MRTERARLLEETAGAWRWASSIVALALVLVASVIVAGGAAADQDAVDAQDAASSGPEAARDPAASYKVSMTGLHDKKLRELLDASSQLVALQDRPPATVAGLRRRADEDIDRLRKVLRSEGYYSGQLSYGLDSSATRIAVDLRVTEGPRYRVATFDVSYVGNAIPDAASRPSLQQIGITLGMPARGPDLVAAQQKLVRYLGEHGRPFAKIANKKFIVDREAHTMTARVSIDAGPSARFGETEISGLDTVEQEYVNRLLYWQRGEAYDSRKVSETREALLKTGLFSSVTITPSDRPTPSERLTMAIRVTERPHRTIGAGLSFSTDIGVGGEVFWEHRNFFGANETLRVSGKAAQIEQSAEVRLRKPAFRERDQALVSSAALIRKNTDAFDERSVSGFLGLERQWTKHWRTIVGLAPSYDDIEDGDGDRRFVLLGVPAKAFLDTSDNVLNPTRGVRLDVAVTPYVGTGSDTLAFLTGVVGLSSYHQVDKKGRFILAGRARVGSLVGASTSEVPANKRFYAGGGGSIRGYEFQRVGPLDSNNDPLGGRSLLELSGELRIRVTDTIGVVPFVDGGTVFDEPYPDFDETVRWAAGLGLRYYTAIGPIRVDFGFPINRRDDVDDVFQFYISFGQAF